MSSISAQPATIDSAPDSAPVELPIGGSAIAASPQVKSLPETALLVPDNNEEKIPIPDVSHLVTEDDTPVDNLIQEKLQRFLVHCLYSSLKLGIPFLAAADLGLFYGINQTESLAPDVLLSLDVSVPEDWSEQRKRSYFIWEFGKPPDAIVEIVSNKKGGELSDKLQKYAQIGVAYYVVFDPLEQLSSEILQVYVLYGRSYQRLQDAWLESVGLGLTVWEGEFEGKYYHRWLRWCNRDGSLLLTGDERAKQAEEQLEQERQQAEEQLEQERQQAEEQLAQERQRAERLAELLRSHNINPDE